MTPDENFRFVSSFNERLGPIIGPMIAAGSSSDFAPPTREGWYELHDVMS